MKKAIANGKWVRVAVLSVAGVLLPTLSSAERSPAWKELDARSNGKGFTASRLPVLVRKPGIGNDAMGDKVRNVLASKLGLNTSAYQKGVEAKYLGLHSTEWDARISDDGNNVRVLMGGNRTVRIPKSSQPSYPQIEAAGRKFISEVLADFITLAKNETLVPLGTKYGHSIGLDVQTKTRVSDDTHQWTMTFGRAIDGELVVGGGALVQVSFRGDNTVEAFEFDWPQYEATGTFLDTLPPAAVRARGRGFETSRGNPPQSREKLFECGFFDPGGKSPRRRLQQIQPGCFQTYVASSGPADKAVEAGIVVAIPAAKEPLNDAKWPEAASHCAQSGAVCRAAP